MPRIWSAPKFAAPTARALAGVHRFDETFGEHSDVDQEQRIMNIVVEIDCVEAHQAARRGSA
jgi:hypothetical protein